MWVLCSKWLSDEVKSNKNDGCRQENWWIVSELEIGVCSDDTRCNEQKSNKNSMKHQRSAKCWLLLLEPQNALGRASIIHAQSSIWCGQKRHSWSSLTNAASTKRAWRCSAQIPQASQNWGGAKLRPCWSNEKGSPKRCGNLSTEKYDPPKQQGLGSSARCHGEPQQDRAAGVCVLICV